MMQTTIALDQPKSSLSPVLPKHAKVLLLVAPALVLLGFIYLLPLLKLAILSFELPSTTLKHYAEFLGEEIYLRVLYKTFKIALVTTLICLILGYIVAHFLANASRGVQQLCLMLIVMSYLTSFLVRAYALIVILSDGGVINGIMLWLGVVTEPIKLVYNTTGVYVGMVQVMLPFMILPLYGVMKNIDGRLTLAAHSLGAGPIPTFFRVYFPLSMPGVISGSILVFVLSLGFYITPALLGGLSDIMIVNLIDVQARQIGNWGFAAAASIILLALTIIGFVLIGRLAGEAGLIGLLTGDMRQSSQRPVRLGLVGSGCKRVVAAIFISLKLVRNMLKAAAPSASAWQVTILRRTSGIGRQTQGLVVALSMVFLICPIFIVLPMSFSSAQFITFPPPGWSTQWYEELFRREDWIEALFNSIQVAVGSSVLSTIAGTLVAYAVVKWRFVGRSPLVFLVISPIIVPPIIIGIGLYGYYVSWGLHGTILGLILAHSVGGVALVFVCVSATLARYDFSLEQAASSLGARPLRTFFSVTLPIIRPGIVAGALFSFINSFDELVITLLIAGIRTETLPLKIWINIRNEIDPVIAVVSVLLIILPLVWLALLAINQRRSHLRAAN